MSQFAGYNCFGLKPLQEIRITRDGIIDDLDGAELVERDVPPFVDSSHAANANPREDLVFIADDHPGLKLMATLQPGLICRTDVVVARIGFVARGTIFHRFTLTDPALGRRARNEKNAHAEPGACQELANRACKRREWHR